MFRTLTLPPEKQTPDPPIEFDPLRFTLMEAASNVVVCARMIPEASRR